MKPKKEMVAKSWQRRSHVTEETLVKKISTLVNRIDDHVTLTPDFHSVIKAAEFSPKDLLM